MNSSSGKRQFQFVKHRKKFFLFSLVMVVIGAVLLLTVGLNRGIDFESGSRVQLMANETLSEEQVYDDFAEAGKGYEPDDITLAGENSEIASATFIGTLNKEEVTEVQTYFEEKYGQVPSVSTVSPQVGEELAKNAFISVLISAVGIVLYVTIRFQFLYGVAAIVSLLHDAFFIIAFFSLLQFEVNIPFIAAVLTIVGYSINDTIVTFDRIRENMKNVEKIKTFDDLAYVVDLSLNQTLTRSINTVLTVVFAAAALFILGGESIRSFSLALLIGLVAGTYSSLFLAAQLWVIWKWKHMEKERKKPKKEEPEELEPEV